MSKIIMYTGILSSGWILVSVIIGIIIGLLLAVIKAVAHLAFTYPKKYAFYASVTLAALIVGGYALYNPSFLDTLNEKIAGNTVLMNIVSGIAIIVCFMVVLSVVRIANGIFRGE